jgi:hypothetical protein
MSKSNGPNMASDHSNVEASRTLLSTAQKRRQCHDGSDFRKLRRLQQKRPQRDPTFGTVDFFPDSKHQ